MHVSTHNVAFVIRIHTVCTCTLEWNSWFCCI